jgi:hypothetical protein
MHAIDSVYPSATLARFAAELNAGQIPPAVLRRSEDLLLDWLASALAGKGAEPVEIIGRCASPPAATVPLRPRCAARSRGSGPSKQRRMSATFFLSRSKPDQVRPS